MGASTVPSAPRQL
uniref:Uncharacterized protein n=1 Tax=Arundo donax TaxID=35708 RepID=A0A0A9AN68_ARUDO